MKRQSVALIATGIALTFAAVMGSLITGSWLIFIAWLVIALVLGAIFAVPGARPSLIFDGDRNPITCPNCGGTGFFRARSTSGLTAGFLIFGWVGALLAPKSQICCSTCGATYPRP